MKNFYEYLNMNSYSSIEWKFMKISFSLIWFLSFLSILYKYNFAPTPESIFKLFPQGFYFSTNAKILLFIANLILIYCYILEKYFWWTLLGLSLISLFGFSLEDSNSDFDRNTMITGIFIAQFLAYSIKKIYIDFDIQKFRVQFSVQIIAISYTLSAIAKLKTSGLNWVTDGLMMPLQIMKTNYFGYVNDANLEHIHNAHHVIELLSKYSVGVMFVLAFTLIIEFFAFVSVYSKKISFIYGLLLMFMHLGIYLIL
ncbi:MAG: hypothetical protein K9G64_05070, partial [Bacteroidia bacterium]|nr:hypothetical protein [Bacteroidia bacterium]